MPSQPNLEKCSKPCVIGSTAVLGTFICIILISSGYNKAAAVFGVIAAVFFLIVCLTKTKKSKNNVEWESESDSAILYIISSAERTTPSPPPAVHHSSQSALSLSSQLSHAYYTRSSNFSPYIASQTTDVPGHSTSPSPCLLSPSALATLRFSSSEVAQQGAVDVSTRQAASQQPPAYPDIVDNYSGLPLQPYSTLDTDEETWRVVDPSSDGLPSYEAAVSMRQTLGDDAVPP